MDTTDDVATRIEHIGPDEMHAIPLAELPTLIRIAADRKAELVREWQASYGNFRERRHFHTLYFHCQEHLGITAAEKRADIEPQVIDAGEYSLRQKARIVAIEGIERQLQQELEVKLVVARTVANACSDLPS